MPWPRFWSTSPNDTSSDELSKQATNLKSKAQTLRNESPSSSTLLSSLTTPSTLLATTLLTTTILTLLAIQRRYLRRFPTAPSLPQTYILPNTRKYTRSIFGHVTTIGDADNFRLFHTPLGRLGLWGLMRKIPSDTKALRGNTIHIRLAGVDAPELSHFGRPAQPYSAEAMEWLTEYLRGRRVRCYVHKADQYGRVVATVYMWRWFLRRDVGLQMLRAGLATVYEAKSGAEFGGAGVEETYRAAEELAKMRGRGMWVHQGGLESPREYKNRYREGGGASK